MTTLQGNDVIPKLANEDQEAKLQNLVNISEKLKMLYEEQNEILESLPKGVPLVSSVCNDGLTEFRTYVIDAPVGHYVYYHNLSLTMNTKTTKKDQKTLGL